MTRSEAIAAGSPFYDEGRKPCPRGHLPTKRYVSSGNCVVCQTMMGIERQRLAYATKPEVREFRRRWHILRTYGLTSDAYDAMIAAQGGNCAACSRPLTPGKHSHVDHCHKTGKVRALLCQGCNVALGAIGDDPERLRLLAAYLEHHGSHDSVAMSANTGFMNAR